MIAYSVHTTHKKLGLLTWRIILNVDIVAIAGIGAHWARDEMCRDRQGRQRDNRSGELRPTGWQKKKDQGSRVRQERQKDKRIEE
ncbi:hypothetical protein TNCV_1031371 [Trichonephila clavipes]|nr:hypothetical protein TNCV_1031371 [Trichonephila clavipes]